MQKKENATGGQKNCMIILLKHLGVVNLYVGMITSQPENEKEMVQKTMELVDQSITEIRQLSANLKPPVFNEQGMKEAIQRPARQYPPGKRNEFFIGDK